MTLTMAFTNNVLHALKARQKKAKDIADAVKVYIETGIAYHKSQSILSTLADPSTFDYKHEDKGENGPDVHQHEFWMGSRKEGATLGIETSTDGTVKVTNVTYRHSRPQETVFNADSMGVDEVLAKIITIVQKNDLTLFGPLMTETAKLLWKDQLGNKPETAPGYVKPEPVAV